MKKSIAVVIAFVAMATLAGFGVASATVGQQSREVEITEMSLQSGDRVYAFPQNEMDAFNACVRSAREMRGIPGELGAYQGWYYSNQGSALWNEWNEAYEHCVDTKLWTRGKWNWDNMVLISGGN